MVCSCSTREALRLDKQRVLYTYAMRKGRPHHRAVAMKVVSMALDSIVLQACSLRCAHDMSAGMPNTLILILEELCIHLIGGSGAGVLRVLAVARVRWGTVMTSKYYWGGAGGPLSYSPLLGLPSSQRMVSSVCVGEAAQQRSVRSSEARCCLWLSAPPDDFI